MGQLGMGKQRGRGDRRRMPLYPSRFTGDQDDPGGGSGGLFFFLIGDGPETGGGSRMTE
jgi:hypothetical protein